MGAIENKMKIEFESRSENESFARIVAAAFILNLDPTLEEMNDFKTAVSEAVTNCIIHAYDEGPGEIVLEIKTIKYDKLINDKKGCIEVKIKDSGCGIVDVERAMEPLYTTKSDEERSGMGFAFMEAFMDELICDSVIDNGTTIFMKKYIKANGSETDIWLEGKGEL